MGVRSLRNVVLAVVTTIAVGAQMPAASAWTDLRVIDGDGGRNGRIRTTIGRTTASTMHQGDVHLFYVTEGRLRHAAFQRPTVFETIDVRETASEPRRTAWVAPWQRRASPGRSTSSTRT